MNHCLPQLLRIHICYNRRRKKNSTNLTETLKFNFRLARYIILQLHEVEGFLIVAPHQSFSFSFPLPCSVRLPFSPMHSYPHSRCDRDHTWGEPGGAAVIRYLRPACYRSCQSAQLSFCLSSGTVIWGREKFHLREKKTRCCSFIRSKWMESGPSSSELIGKMLWYRWCVTQEDGMNSYPACRTSIQTPATERSKYIHGMYSAISARDHTILPPHGDKIRYFSYFNVFSFISSRFGEGGGGSVRAPGKINKHLKRFHC